LEPIEMALDIAMSEHGVLVHPTEQVVFPCAGVAINYGLKDLVPYNDIGVANLSELLVDASIQLFMWIRLIPRDP
jgi:hypothetical protein